MQTYGEMIGMGSPQPFAVNIQIGFNEPKKRSEREVNADLRRRGML